MAENLAKVVTTESITRALEDIILTKPSLIPSTKFDLVYKGMQFPPKEVVRKAAQIQNIVNWQNYRLSGGESSNNYLREKGFDVRPKATATRYFIGGAIWGVNNDYTNEFIEEGYWENGHEDKFTEQIKDVPKGALFAIKSSFAKGKESILRIKCIGEVVENKGDGKTLLINWVQHFESFDIPGLGGYRQTFHEITNENDINSIFNFDGEAEEIDLHMDAKQGSNSVLSLNSILYGPPGTGKTYNTIDKAMQIVAPDVYESFKVDRKELTKQFRERLINDWKNPKGQIAFVTFHQSMSYEDFVEGIKPIKPEATNTVHYDIIDGIFKRMCMEASRTRDYIITIDGIQKTLNKELFEEMYYAFSETLPPHTAATSSVVLKTKENNPFELFRNSADSIVVKAGEKRTGQNVAHSELQAVLFEDKPPTYKSYEYIIIDKILDGKNFQRSTTDNSSKNFVLIIDEINRGNISQIFGELITLIEESKRAGKTEALSVMLPYSKKPFTVPANLYIIGTMNTADRSVEALDTALRRRFSFEFMPPNLDTLKNDDNVERSINGISLYQLLDTINKRITYLLDQDHQIGHSYFINITTEEQLKTVFKNNILPLLLEFFYNDFSKIRLVLGDGFVTKKSVKPVFATLEEDDIVLEKLTYTINTIDEGFDIIAALKKTLA